MKWARKRKGEPTGTVQHKGGSRPKLVWSGPDASGRLGNTRRVYEELFDSARRSLWVSSFVYDDGPDVFRRLGQHLDATPGLRVTIVLSVTRYSTQKNLRRKTVARRFAKRFWKTGSPGKIRPRVFYDSRPIAGELARFTPKWLSRTRSEPSSHLQTSRPLPGMITSNSGCSSGILPWPRVWSRTLRGSSNSGTCGRFRNDG